ncbi:MAG: ATP-dependent helicase [Deltaproteobacteria bacterium]|nr:ATP-dependent helicase [Deltaproteobacteria bacterium]
MDLNSEQHRAATFGQGHVLVLAGAGTGKTRTIIARAAHLIRNDVAPHRILLLTFTRRAAREMVVRLRQMIGTGAARLQAGTFHHFCLKTMRRMPDAFMIQGATVIDRDDQIQLMRLIRSEIKEKGRSFPRASELVNLCSYARNTLQSAEDYLYQHSDYDASDIDRICQVFESYGRRKRVNRYLDYDDILFRFVERLHADHQLSRKLGGLYDHILVDEMQDTNPLQWQVLEALHNPAWLFCVGDDAQSIYAFRGADFRNVHAFTDRVSGSVVLRLEENYRSTQGILDVSNWLLQGSSIAYDKNLIAHRKKQSKPLLLNFNNDFNEAEWVASDLSQRHKTGRPWRDHMIITRTGYGARAIESFMVENDIPYQFVGGTSLLQTAHVKDLLSLVRAAFNHRDELAWARYLTLWPKIGDVTAARLIKAMHQSVSVSDALVCLAERLKGRDEIIQGPRIISSNFDSPADAITEASRFLLPMMEKRYDNWRTRRHDYELLIRLAGNHRSLSAFLEAYTLDPISISSAAHKEDDDIVTLTTVHSAKGTEAPVCYLIRVEPGMYPHKRSMGSEAEREEERRILYVAMTRAQDELIITRTHNPYGCFPSQGGGFRGWGQSVSDYFIEDLDAPLVDEIDGSYL